MTIEVAGRLLAASLVVACVLGALRIALARVPRGFAPGRQRELAVLETAFLPGGASLHIVGTGERRFAIVRSTHAIAIVCELGVAPAHAGMRDG